MDLSLEAKTKPPSTLSAFSYIPPRRNEPREMSYFNKESKASDVTTYDQVFHQEKGFDMRLRRDDRKHWRGRGLDINQEERSRVVPVLSSSEYGRRSAPSLYQTERQFARVACIKSEFYMKNGIIWNVAEGYGSVVPI
ncbi:cilia- and flagella-associated protein 90 [Leuresthes tenuis]|uniref:cilia- and flagella-associated protein 90 n=1 Tax=Leuresthes tenuis TaxID=355514 RepID=UPI003B514E8A